MEKFPEVVWRLKSMLEKFADALSCIDQCFIAEEMLEELPAASRVGKTIVGGIDLNKARMRAVIAALIALSASPNGFTARGGDRTVMGFAWCVRKPEPPRGSDHRQSFCGASPRSAYTSL